MANSLYEFDAIGTHWWIERLDGVPFNNDIIHSLEVTAEAFDQRYSRFREDSLVAELARSGRVYDVPSEMIRMLEFAKQLYKESGGVFNISVGGALHALGYGSRAHGAAVVTEPWKQVTWRENTVTAPKGMMLDFGGFGKGWLIEQFVGVLRAHGVKHFLVNGGGDIYVDAPELVEFALESPYDPLKSIGQTKIQKGALAGSSSLKRSWQYRGETHHHIIDPVTEKPASSGVVASFVRADSALIADTVATIIMIRPSLNKFFKHRYNLQTILVRADNE